MNNDRSVSGERRESHNVTLQWCSREQSKTTTLNISIKMLRAHKSFSFSGVFKGQLELNFMKQFLLCGAQFTRTVLYVLQPI